MPRCRASRSSLPILAAGLGTRVADGEGLGNGDEEKMRDVI